MDAADPAGRWTSEPKSTSMTLVTGAFHDTLGLRRQQAAFSIKPTSGICRAEAQAVAVLSYSATALRGDQSAIGRTSHRGAALHHRRITPRGFFGVAVGLSPDVTIPVTMLASPERSTDRAGQLGPLLAAHHGPPSPRPVDRPGRRRLPAVWTAALAATQSPDAPASWRARYLTVTSGLEPAPPAARRFEVSSRPRCGCCLAWSRWSWWSPARPWRICCSRLRPAAVASWHRLAIGAGRAQLVQQLLVEGLLLAPRAARWAVSSRPGPPTCSCGCSRPATTR